VARAFAAVDLGAESGRVLVGRLRDGQLTLREVHRFPNRPVRVRGSLRWDIHRLYAEILTGIHAAAAAHPGLCSVAVDAWGVDFGLLDARGKLLGLPYHYRDRRTEGVPARLHARVPAAELWASTGVQPLAFNTLYQLHAMVLHRSSTLARAARLLLVPDLVTCWLSGIPVTEQTIASTTQCWDLERRAWLTPQLARAGIPGHIFPPAVEPGTRLGPLVGSLARRTGLARVQVVAPAGHDTASAVAAVPARGRSFAYVSSGTWSLVGALVDRPVKTDAARRLGLTNEGGADGTVCLHRTMAGMWLVQECRRAWARAGEGLDYHALAALAAAGRPLRSAFDPDDPTLLAPADMPAAIRACCARGGQAAPETRADLLRAILESLAWRYRRTVRDLEGLLGRRIEAVHVVGGGSRNALLCQLTADACGRPVVAGPVEATALGNLLAQAVAAGACASWEEARALVRASFAPVVYEPRDTTPWDDAYTLETAAGGLAAP
jgi:rhamnulokinase